MRKTITSLPFRKFFLIFFYDVGFDCRGLGNCLWSLPLRLMLFRLARRSSLPRYSALALCISKVVYIGEKINGLE